MERQRINAQHINADKLESALQAFDPLIETEMTMTTDAETVVRRAYHAAEGNVMDVQGFIDLFADDGVINAGKESYRGEHLSYVVVFLGKLAPDVHRELPRLSRSSCRSGAPSLGRTSRPQESFSRPEPSSMAQAPTSGTWKTARSRSSTATSASTSCSNKWAYSPTSHP
jgi:hypothetical protein